MSEQKPDWKKILEEARRLEKGKSLSDEELARMKKESLQEAEKLRKLLAEQWFIKDKDVEKKKSKKK